MKKQTLWLLIGGGVVVVGGVAYYLAEKSTPAIPPHPVNDAATLPPVAVPAPVSATSGPFFNPKAHIIALHVPNTASWGVAQAGHIYGVGTALRMSFPTAPLPANFGDILRQGIEGGNLNFTNALITKPNNTVDWGFSDDPNSAGWHVEALLTVAGTVAYSPGGTFAPPQGLWGSTVWVRT